MTCTSPTICCIYLVVVVVVAVVGGFWPAVLAAVTASLLLNWYLTPPLHTLTIAEPENLLALLLFVAVAVTVSSIVHLAARRAVLAARSNRCGGAAGTGAHRAGRRRHPGVVAWPADQHLAAAGPSLLEHVRGQWVTVAVSGSAPAAARPIRVALRPGLALVVSGQSAPVTGCCWTASAPRPAAALDRDRLRTQAAQAEALGEANRVRTALLTAVSHDLRTPLASIKAASAPCARTTSPGRQRTRRRCSPPSRTRPTGSTA